MQRFPVLNLPSGIIYFHSVCHSLWQNLSKGKGQRPPEPAHSCLLGLQPSYGVNVNSARVLLLSL